MRYLLWRIILASVAVLAMSTGARADDGPRRHAVVYYNEACDECLTYINGDLADVLSAQGIEPAKKDYINQRENRRELNDLNARLGIPLDLQSHLVTIIDGGKIVLQGEPPRTVVETLLASSTLPDRILVYSDEGGDGSYKAWAFAGPVQSYRPGAPIEDYLRWFEANRGNFPSGSAGGAGSEQTLLLPVVLFTGLVDGINPCAMAILLFFVSFLFTIRKRRASIARIGAVYIGAVFVVYLLIGLGLLRATTLIQGHWLGQAGAVLLMLVGLINVLGVVFPRFPIRLELPESGKEGLKAWMYRATVPASLVLGGLMGLESFPCSGGPYVAILGLIGSQANFWKGAAYLVLYNLMFVLPLVVVLVLSLNPVLGSKIQSWERSSSHAVRGATGGVMVVLGLGLLIWLS